MIIKEAWVTQVLPIVVGKDNEGNIKWRRQDYRLEYYDENPRYPDSICISRMNDDIEKYNLKQGDMVSLGVGHSTREYNGRLYLDLHVFNLRKIFSAGEGGAAPNNGSTQTATGGAENNTQTANSATPQGAQAPAQDNNPLPEAGDPDNLPF